MAEFRVNDLSAEESEIRSWGLSPKSTQERIDYVRRLARRAAAIPGGFVKKIVWDEAGGYPRHAWGFVQYSIRPFWPGFGCDGTTDNNVHLIASCVCEAAGVDYAACHFRAYGHREGQTLEDSRAWLRGLRLDETTRRETVLPDVKEPDALILALSDLYQVNNRSLCAVLVEELEARGHHVGDFCFREKDARERSFARAATLARE